MRKLNTFVLSLLTIFFNTKALTVAEQELAAIPVSNTTIREQLKDFEKRGRPSGGGSRPSGGWKPSYRPPSTPSWPSYPSAPAFPTPSWGNPIPKPSPTFPSPFSPSKPSYPHPSYRPPHYPHNRPNQCSTRCGDGVCEGKEDCITCPSDCAGEGRNTFCCGSDYTKCDDSRCNQDEYKCSTRCSSSVLSANISLVNVMFSCGATMFLIFML